jgi:hypothetical protein
MSLLEGCYELVDRHLGIDDTWEGKPPRYSSPTSLHRVQPANLPDGNKLIADLYDRMVQNWEAGGCPQNGSSENWRFERRPDFQDVERSPEVPLERTIIQVVDHENWGNQIPVDSGLLGGGSRSLDLAFRAGLAFEFIELKVASNTPLSAAIQVLLYGLTNAFFRTHSRQLEIEDLPTPLLRATEIRLRVLAPIAFYERFAANASWLEKLENTFDEGVRELSSSVLSEVDIKFLGFRFDVFPKDFHWDQTRHNDEEHRKEVLVAVHRRHPYFGR